VPANQPGPPVVPTVAAGWAPPPQATPPAYAPAKGPDIPPARNPVLNPAPNPVQKRSGLPVLLIFLGFLAVAAAMVIAGIVYVGYQVKDKVTTVSQQVKQALPAPDPAPAGQVDRDQSAPAADDGNPGGILGNLGTMLGEAAGGEDDGDPVESISAKDPVIPCSAGTYPAQSAARIPLQPGTVVTTAWGIKNGDVETRDTVAASQPTSLTFSADAPAYKDDLGHDWKGSNSRHTVCNNDFATADTYATVTGTNMPEIVHGLTRLRLSDKSFNELKSAGKTDLIYWDVISNGDAVKPTHEGGLLTRVEPQDIPYPMIVNDQRVNLPVIHLAGVMDSVGKDPTPKKDRPYHSAADMYVIDDPLDPLVLMFKLKDPKLHDGKFRVEVTKIDYPVPHPVNLVEKQLAEQKRAVTWGIYFDFNKDTIKPESAPVLKQIVQAMTDNPEWKLTVEGNTDNIGGDAYNLDLSKRRAAAVKEALVTQYHIAPDRLSTNGFGASHPIDTNETLEGRARNRRVELSRE
jgi:outer membrane protein OmpA-like peptidoglycan-associated protein